MNEDALFASCYASTIIIVLPMNRIVFLMLNPSFFLILSEYFTNTNVYNEATVVMIGIVNSFTQPSDCLDVVY